MEDDEKECLYEKRNIKINIDSIKLKVNSGDIFLYTNNFIIKQENKSSIISINYKDITFHAIEKQKKMIIICDGKKYDIIHLFLNNEEDTINLFNTLSLYIKNNNDNEKNIELDEEIDKDNLLAEWEKKMVFNENFEENSQDELDNQNKKAKNEIFDNLGNEYESYNYENTIDKLNFK